MLRQQMTGTLFQTSMNMYSLNSRINFTDLALGHPVCWDCQFQSGQTRDEMRGEDPSQVRGKRHATLMALQVFSLERRKGKTWKNRRVEKRVTYGSILFKTNIVTLRGKHRQNTL